MVYCTDIILDQLFTDHGWLTLKCIGASYRAVDVHQCYRCARHLQLYVVLL